MATPCMQAELFLSHCERVPPASFEAFLASNKRVLKVSGSDGLLVGWLVGCVVVWVAGWLGACHISRMFHKWCGPRTSL